jgi:hypothetical protein
MKQLGLGLGLSTKKAGNRTFAGAVGFSCGRCLQTEGEHILRACRRRPTIPTESQLRLNGISQWAVLAEPPRFEWTPQ